MSERSGASNPIELRPPVDEGWDPVAERWDAWSPVTDHLFGPATTALLEMLALKPGEQVLELAAGSGGLTLHLARAVGPSGRVLATDLGPKMLRLAARNAARAGQSNVDTRVMDGQNPDVASASIDVVACRQALMLFPDSAQALEHLFPILRPSGRIGVTVFSTFARNRFLAVPVEALARWEKPLEDSPAETGGPGPFSLGARGKLEAMLGRAGFTDVKSRIVASTLRTRSVEEMLRFYREILSGLVSDVPEAERENAWAEIGKALVVFSKGDVVEAPCEILVVTARRPGLAANSA
jgi:SAM-dependent methyltransferase